MTFTAGDLVARGLAFASLLFAARVVGTAAFGRFAVAYAAVAILMPVCDMGLTPLVTRRLSIGWDRHVFWTAMAVNASLAGATYALLALATVLLAPSGAALFFVYGSVLIVQAAATSFDAVFIAGGRVSSLAWIRLCGNALTATAVFVGMSVIGHGLVVIAGAFVLGSVAKAAIEMVVLGRTVGRPSFSLPTAAGLIREAFPFAIAAVLSLLYFRVDTLLLRAFVSPARVGVYAAAFRLIDALMLLPAGVIFAFFPGWARPGRRRSDVAAVGVALAAFGTACAAVGIALAPQVIALIFGASFKGSTPVLRILLLGLPLIYVDMFAVWVGYALRRERQVIWCGAAALCANLALNLALIPRLHERGAAAATVVSELVNFLGYLWIFRAAIRAEGGAFEIVARGLGRAVGSIYLLGLRRRLRLEAD